MHNYFSCTQKMYIYLLVFGQMTMFLTTTTKCKRYPPPELRTAYLSLKKFIKCSRREQFLFVFPVPNLPNNRYQNYCDAWMIFYHVKYPRVRDLKGENRREHVVRREGRKKNLKNKKIPTQTTDFSFFMLGNFEFFPQM